MRTSSRIRNMKKKPNRSKVNKNKNYSKSIAIWDRNFDISRSNIENINEVMRMHKLRHAEGKLSWKLVPKDSCEVYKERLKRQTEIKRTRDAEEEFSDRNGRSKTKFHRKLNRKQKKRMARKTNKTSRKYQQRVQPESSQSSMSSTLYSSTTSNTSVSETE